MNADDVDRVLTRVPAKDRPGVMRFIRTKVAAGQTWNSIRTTTMGLARLSGFFEKTSMVPMVKAGTDDVLKALAKLQAAATSPAWYVRLLREYLTFHDREDVMRKVKTNGRPRQAAPDPSKWLTREDVARMVSKARDVRDRALIAVLWDTGARIHEVVALDLRDLERRGTGKDSVITAYFRKMKVRGTERRLPLHEATPTLKAYLATRRDAKPEEPLFVSRREGLEAARLSTQSARAQVHTVARLAKLGKPSHPHAFRHSRNYDLKRRGVSSEARALWFGWAPGSKQVDRYGASGVEDAAAEVAGKLGYRPLPKPAPVAAIEDLVKDFTPTPTNAEVDAVRAEIRELREKLGAVDPATIELMKTFIETIKRAQAEGSARVVVEAHRNP